MNHPYPNNNNVKYKVKTPIYVKNNTTNNSSRYSVYQKIDNYDFPALEIKLTNSISKNDTYLGYYYTTTKNETLYQISKKYYDDEKLWWVLAKANNLKNEGISVLNEGITLSIPAKSELNRPGGYFNNAV